MNLTEPDERRARTSREIYGVPPTPIVAKQAPRSVEAGDTSKYPQYSKEQCEVLGYEPVV